MAQELGLRTTRMCVSIALGLTLGHMRLGLDAEYLEASNE